MPPAHKATLEELLRAATDAETLPVVAPQDDPVARRIALYAELVRLAPPAAPGSRGRLLVPTETGGVSVFPLGEAPLEIGRSIACAIRLEDREVSRRHCRVELDASGNPSLDDLDSANGTFVNDQRISHPVALRDGDVIRVGRTLIVAGCP